MYGSEIVESFYDFETKKIGPYTIPIDIQYKEDKSAGNAFSIYRYYDLMQKRTDLLAIFNNNNYCFVALTQTSVELLPYHNSDLYYKRNGLPFYPLDTPITLPKYQHIGFVKTYQKCLAIYTWPWKLLGDIGSGVVYDSDCKLSGTPLENPPLSLYKYLIDTDFDAVYFDLEQNKPVFINMKKGVKSDA